MPEQIRASQQQDSSKTNITAKPGQHKQEEHFVDEYSEQEQQRWQRAVVSPSAASPHDILSLQRKIGNRAAGQFLRAGIPAGRPVDSQTQVPAPQQSQDSGTYSEPVFHNMPAQMGSRQPAPRSLEQTTPDRAAIGSQTLTLPKLAEFDEETQAHGFWGRQGMKPTYYHPAAQPNPYKLDIQDGRLQQAGAALTTRGTLPQFHKDKAHRYMFTMSGSGDFHAAGVRQGFAEHGRVHHTTMSGGAEAAAAGELQINQGRLEAISDSSGHYRPAAALTYQALQGLQSQGVDLSTTNVELSGKKASERALSISATEMMAYQPEMDAARDEARRYRTASPLHEGDRETRETKLRKILNKPEKRIREAHALKDTMMQELLQKTAAQRQKLDQAGPAAAQGRRNLGRFEYQEAILGTYQASSAMSRKISPEQAKAARAELERYREGQKRIGLHRQAGSAVSTIPDSYSVPPTLSGRVAAPQPASQNRSSSDTSPRKAAEEMGERYLY